LVPESLSGTDFSSGLTNWLLQVERLWPAKFERPIQNIGRDQRLARWGLIGHSFLRFGMTSTEPVADDSACKLERVRPKRLAPLSFESRLVVPAPRSLFQRARRPRDEVRGAPKAQRKRLTRTRLILPVRHVVLVVIAVVVVLV
jgi:hypothetical protein